jgi:uncharacterized protein (TIGR03067 family)
MSSLAKLYPGDEAVLFWMTVAATASLVLAIGWVASLFLERHPVARHAVVLSALLASLASPALTAAYIASGNSLATFPLLSARVDGVAEERPIGDPARLNDPSQAAAAGNTGQPAAGTPLTRPLPDAHQIMTTQPGLGVTQRVLFRSTVATVLLLWLCGTAVLIAELGRSGLFLYRLYRSMRPISDRGLHDILDEAKRLVGTSTSASILTSRLACTPLAAGLFRPVIVLPSELLGAINRLQLRDVLVHELAHIERRDHLIILLQAIAKAAFWPIVFIHLLNRQLARAREDICDDHVLASRDAADYGETLLRLAQLACVARLPVGTVGIFQRRGELERRVSRLIHNGRSKMTRLHPLITAGVAAIFILTSALLCGTRFAEAQTGKQKQVSHNKKETKEPKRDAEQDKEKVQGMWAIVRLVDSEQDEHGVIGGMEVTGDKVVWTSALGGIEQTLKLDTTKDPKWIDLTYVKETMPSPFGKSNEESSKGVYRLDGNRLTLLLAPADKARPRDLDAKPGAGQTLIVLRRLAPSDQ